MTDTTPKRLSAEELEAIDWDYMPFGLIQQVKGHIAAIEEELAEAREKYAKRQAIDAKATPEALALLTKLESSIAECERERDAAIKERDLARALSKDWEDASRVACDELDKARAEVQRLRSALEEIAAYDVAGAACTTKGDSFARLASQALEPQP